MALRPLASIATVAGLSLSFAACNGQKTASSPPATDPGGAKAGSAGGNASGGASTPVAASPEGESVLQRNKQPTRAGLFVEPQLTPAAAAGMHLDPSFSSSFPGNVYASPLYVEGSPSGRGTFYIATESDGVHAIAEANGAIVWSKSLGTAAGAAGVGCGNIAPIGITGTPAIDLPSRTLFVDAATGTGAAVTRHLIHALSLDDGSERSGFPVDPSTLASAGFAFDPAAENQRGALLLSGGMVYVPYGGHFGDCGAYRGFLAGVPVSGPAGAKAWVTGARGGGMWAPGGLATDGQSLFAATGNTFDPMTWSQGEAILRLSPSLAFSGQPADYFTPSNWKELDASDEDLGGSGPVLVDLPGASPSALVVALGKNGIAYLLDRTRLSGTGIGNGTTGEGLTSARVVDGRIINAAATYKTARGTYVVLHASTGGTGAGCPSGQNGDLVALRLGASSPPTLTVAWCADNQGQGSPIATSTDGQSNAIVWTAGAEGSQRLHGFDGDTGAVVFGGGTTRDVMAGTVRRFTSPIAVHGRIIVGADGALYAFTTGKAAPVQGPH